MLDFLRIRDLALIADIEMDFAPGMNTLTGETGAGKSFIMRAVDFITGERMTADMVRPGREKARVEALFTLEDEELLIRRELSAETGRSRVFLNDSLASKQAVETVRDKLVLHTSQHKQQELLSQSFQARILDGFLDNPDLLRERGELLSNLRRVAAKRRETEARIASLQEQREFLEYQKGEIDKVDPGPGEEEELLSRKESLRERQGATRALKDSLSLLVGEGGLAGAMDELSRTLDKVAAGYPDLASEAEAVEEFRQRLRDLEVQLRTRSTDQGGEEDLDSLESRLFELSSLKRKLGKSLAEIGELKSQIEENLSFLDASDLDLKQLSKEEDGLRQALGALLERLDKARQEAGEALCERLENELRSLGFSEHVSVRFHFEADEIFPRLFENRPRLFFVPNPGQPEQPLDKIASGGELSRLLLALTSLQSEAGLPTLIFDEVDAGIGGVTLNRVGEKLRELAGRQQLVVITHWPQLAGLADRHFQVSKEVRDGGTFTSCARLKGREIAEELSRMAGGGDKGMAVARSVLGRD